MGRLKLQNGDIDMAWYRSLLVTSILSFGFMEIIIALDENPSLRQPIEKKWQQVSGNSQLELWSNMLNLVLGLGISHMILVLLVGPFLSNHWVNTPGAEQLEVPGRVSFPPNTAAETFTTWDEPPRSPSTIENMENNRNGFWYILIKDFCSRNHHISGVPMVSYNILQQFPSTRERSKLLD